MRASASFGLSRPKKLNSTKSSPSRAKDARVPKIEAEQAHESRT